MRKRHEYRLSEIGKIICILLIMLFLAPQAIVKADQLDEEVGQLKTHARITWWAVGAPMGRIILIQKGKDICAVRFTDFRRGHDAKPSTVFRSGDESFYGEYDWYTPIKGSNDFKNDIKSGHRKLVIKPSIGIGRLAFDTGEIYIKCGPFKLYWELPASVSFSGVPERTDNGIEIAPTKWKEISEVDVHDQHIKWYRMDENRKDLYIPLDEL